MRCCLVRGLVALMCGWQLRWGTVLGTSPSPRGGRWLQESGVGCVKPWDPDCPRSPEDPKTCWEWGASQVVSDLWVTTSQSQGTEAAVRLGPR